MKTLLISLSVVILAACGTKKIEGDGSGQNIVLKKSEKKQPAQLGYSKQLPDSIQSFTVLSAHISGNTLSATVQYGGGCEDHVFTLEGSEAISKSLPPIRAIRLVSKGKKDACKALITKNLQFDISKLAYQQQAGSQIYLSLEGLNGNLLYTYSAGK